MPRDGKKLRGTPTTGSYNVPAPVGGINARDALTAMKPEDAVSLTNVFPEASYAVVRGGYVVNSTGMTDPIRTLLVWRGPSVDHLFAAISDEIFDCTTPGIAVGANTTVTDGDWQWTNIENAGGQYLIAVNGNDPMKAYDGTTWTEPSVTVATSSDFQNVCLFKERLWFATQASLDVWYLPIQAIAGAATVFPLGAVFRKGGYVTNMGTFSRDAGEGPDDFLCFFSSNGEMVMYQGTDPDSSDTFQLVGVFNMGQTIGRRATMRMNGDLAVITEDGLISAQAMLQFDRASIQRAAITGKIQTLFSQYAQIYQTNFGWQPCTYAHARYLIVNVPTVTDSTQIQLVMNAITGQWTQFTGMNAGCWAEANNLLYFGGNDGVVYQADSGFQDNGEPIAWNIQMSWQMVGGATNKYGTMIRPIMLVGAGMTYGINIDVDFLSRTVIPYATTAAATGWVWTFTWPVTWSASLVLDAQWRTVGSIGTWGSVHMTGTVDGAGCQFQSWQIAGQTGGLL